MRTRVAKQQRSHEPAGLSRFVHSERLARLIRGRSLHAIAQAGVGFHYSCLPVVLRRA
jgi:hypothetical protein